MARYTTVRTPYDVTRKWQALAERRRAYYVELYRSGRWRRYYSEDVFLAHMREVMSGVEEWNKILSRWPERDGAAQERVATDRAATDRLN